jgi:hypothetical protein
MDGGTENFAEALGTLYAPNLTPGGSLKDWTEGEISRAIPEGVDNEYIRSLTPPAVSSQLDGYNFRRPVTYGSK